MTGIYLLVLGELGFEKIRGGPFSQRGLSMVRKNQQMIATESDECFCAAFWETGRKLSDVLTEL